MLSCKISTRSCEMADRSASILFLSLYPYERQRLGDANNHYNCPIVTSYAENIKNNVDRITGYVRF